MVEGVNNAVLMLLGVVALVEGAFIALFVSFRNRSKALQSGIGDGGSL